LIAEEPSIGRPSDDRATECRRLLLICPDFPPTPGGIQLTMDRVATLLKSFTVDVVTRRVEGYADFDRSRGISVMRAPRARTRTLDLALLNGWAVAAALRRRPDVVLNGHIVTTPAAAVIRRLLGAPSCLYLWADEVERRPRLGAFALREAAATVAVSRNTRKLALAHGADPGEVRFIPPGVDPSVSSRGRTSPRPTIVTVARLQHRFKGHDVLVPALERVRARVPDVEWVVIGDGPLRPELERMIGRSGLNGHVRLAGSVDDEERDALLASAHVFAMPSSLPAESGAEGTGIVFLEASTRGLPVVASRTTGPGADRAEGGADVVIDGETGLLVDPRDPDAVADALVELLEDPVRAERMGRAGARHAARFAWPEIAARVEELLLGLETRR
jgi:phosphatidylinositol alpha-1,6-mannosyltransferase